MIIRINGREIAPLPLMQEEEMIVIKKGMNPVLKPLAITLWTTAASFASKANAAAASPLWDGTKPLIYLFQDVAMFLGVLAILAGLILLAVKKRWGTATLKITAFVILGVFLAPSLILLIAIIGNQLDEAMTTTLYKMREAQEVIGGGR
jgi:membrane-associated PAP2 superfamily phosphatase